MRRFSLYVACALAGCLCPQAAADNVYDPPSEVTPLNSGQNDSVGSITADGSMIVIDSGRNGLDGQIYSATRPTLTSPWGKPSNSDFLNIRPDLTHSSGRPVISADGLTLFFAHQVGEGPYGIFMSTRPNAGSPFGVGTIVSELQVDPAVRPSWLSRDGLRIYFHGQRRNLWHIYMAERRTVSSRFETPSQTIFANLRKTGVADAEATLTPDELQIFFVSDRPGGLGGDDIWWAIRPNTSALFGKPVNLRSINSPRSDRGPVIYGNTLFLASDRKGSGELAIYNAHALDGSQRPGIPKVMRHSTPLLATDVEQDLKLLAESVELVAYPSGHVVGDLEVPSAREPVESMRKRIRNMTSTWASYSKVQNWTDATGEHTVEAQFLASHDGSVTLRKTDGTQVTVSTSKLGGKERNRVVAIEKLRDEIHELAEPIKQDQEQRKKAEEDNRKATAARRRKLELAAERIAADEETLRRVRANLRWILVRLNPSPYVGNNPHHPNSATVTSPNGLVTTVHRPGYGGPIPKHYYDGPLESGDDFAPFYHRRLLTFALEHACHVARSGAGL